MFVDQRRLKPEVRTAPLPVITRASILKSPVVDASAASPKRNASNEIGRAPAHVVVLTGHGGRRSGRRTHSGTDRILREEHPPPVCHALFGMPWRRKRQGRLAADVG